MGQKYVKSVCIGEQNNVCKILHWQDRQQATTITEIISLSNEKSGIIPQNNRKCAWKKNPTHAGLQPNVRRQHRKYLADKQSRKYFFQSEWWYAPLIQARWGQSQEDFDYFDAILVYTVLCGPAGAMQ